VGTNNGPKHLFNFDGQTGCRATHENPGILRVCCSGSCANVEYPNDGEWHHFSLTIPGTQLNVPSYPHVHIDHNFANNINSVILGENVGNTLYIGGEPTLGAGSWKIDEFMIYDVPLTNEQICTELLRGTFLMGTCSCNTPSISLEMHAKLTLAIRHCQCDSWRSMCRRNNRCHNWCYHWCYYWCYYWSYY
jgi:hypothetical protein